MALHKEINFYEKNSSLIKDTFLQLFDTLKNREIQLLRQIEVIDQHYKLTDSYDKCFKDIIVVFDNENDILKSVENFGRIDFHGCDSDVFKIEDYQKPEIDHVSLYKYLETSFSEQVDTNVKINYENIEEVIQVEEQTNTQEINRNTNQVSNSILECIEKNDPKLCLHTKNEKETIILVENETKCISRCDIPSEITNISQSLTNSASVPNLNCKCSEKVTKSENLNITSLKDTKTQSAKNINDITVGTKDFFHVPDQIKIISMKQPIQIQQWMKEIISETEVEPPANNVMEHSHIESIRKDLD